MLFVLTASAAALLLAASPALGAGLPPSGNATNPVINLGSAGSYLGVVQNNGTYVRNSNSNLATLAPFLVLILPGQK